jgi:hypothetical protein
LRLCSQASCLAEEAPSSSSPPLTLHARIENDQTVFHVGELIRLELSYSAAGTGFQASTASYDRSGRLGIEQYVVEPQTGWDDPLKSYYSSGLLLGGGLSSNQTLSAKPYIVHRDLNEWVRFTEAGRYRLMVVSTRAGRANRALGQPNPVVRSNELRITVIPASTEWQAATIADTVAILNSHKASGNPGAIDEERERAVATIRYLGTAAAAEEMARRLNDPAQFQFMLGLVASPAHDAAVAALERALNDPLAPISSTLIYTLSRLSSSGVAQRDMNALNEQHAHVVDQLIAALGHKRGEAQAVSAFTVAQEAENSRPPLSESQRAKLSAYLAAGFDSLPAGSQAELLADRWEVLDPQAMLPLLPKIAARYRDGPVLNEMNIWEANNTGAAALRHWWELDPSGARSTVLAEISRPKPRFGANVIGMLPEKELPEVDHLLADHLLIEDGHDEIVASLIARYATSAIEPQVAGFLDERVGKWRCDTQAALLAYMLRVDARAAAPLIERALAPPRQTGCYRMLLTEIAQIHNDPILEKLSTKSLLDDAPEIVSGAASYLRTYGSASTEALLWARLDSWTSGHPRKSKASMSTEQDPDEYAKEGLIAAIATATAWLADEPKLTRLLTYASTETQRSHIEEYLRAWQMSPKQILAMGGAFNIAQYNLPSISATIEKVKQFPRGTTFAFSGDLARKADQDALASLRNAAVSVGVKVEIVQQ